MKMNPNNLIFATMRWIGIATIVLLVSLLGAGCDKSEGVPAYLSIDSTSFTAGVNQGNNYQQIDAVGVTVDGKVIGIFELPAKIPVFVAGKKKVSLLPYVRLNGSRTKFTWYSTMNSVDTFLTFTASRTTKFVNPTFTFRSTIKISWLEDFEDNNSTLIKANLPPSDTAGIFKTDFDLNGRFKSKTLAYAVKLKTNDTLKVFDLTSFDRFNDFPAQVSDIFFEIDLNTPIELEIALNRRKPGQSFEYVPYLQINPTDGSWKRFYINLQYEIASQPKGTEYVILISGTHAPDKKTDSEVLIDNIRLNFTN